MYENLTKGLAIYRQNHTKSIYVRLRVDGKEIKRSLKTSDIDEAKSRAWRLKFEYESKLTAGLPIFESKEPMINTAIKQILKNMELKKIKKTTFADYKYVFENVMIPFFNRKSVSFLTTKNVRLYFETLVLSKSRITIHKSCFKKLFEHLEEEELLKRSNFPIIPKIETTEQEIRHSFLLPHLTVIEAGFDQYIDQTVGKQAKTKEYRTTLKYYFKFLIETGIRPGEEVKHLKFSDFKRSTNDYGETEYSVLITKGKTARHIKQGRKITLKEWTIEQSILEMAKLQNPDKKVTLKNFNTIQRSILESSEGKFTCYSKQFGNYLKWLDKGDYLRTDRTYTLYSCRHTYITERLKQGVDIYLIAKFVGNKVEMIQNHYDDYKLDMQEHIDQLTGTHREEDQKKKSFGKTIQIGSSNNITSEHIKYIADPLKTLEINNRDK
ncbi:site-specific integrase [Vibrio parahaemolyticus]|uniref:site-specific integrase n=1 Tax=Vibrio parahaemolyticus TaxID=670 RepID=UPI000BE29164|nr:site-specific integrase [Vibrio parahaemolyticus]ATI47111.1 integrase [Vibrio parahaemolyticus]